MTKYMGNEDLLFNSMMKNYQGVEFQPKTDLKDRCRTCGSTGHWARNCPSAPVKMVRVTTGLQTAKEEEEVDLIS